MRLNIHHPYLFMTFEARPFMHACQNVQKKAKTKIVSLHAEFAINMRKHQLNVVL